MTQQQNEIKKDSFKKSVPDFTTHLSAALLATFGAHFARVMMNRAAYHTNPFEVLKEVPRYWRTGMGWNLLRGGSVFGSQSFIKARVYEHIGQDTLEGKLAGLGASALTGSIAASLLETPFIRATLKSPQTNHLPLMRFSLPLSALYFCREAGFSAVVLGAKDFQGLLYAYLFGSAIFITAMCHKYAAWEATADIMEAQGVKTPNLKRDGFWFSLKALAHGQTYNHPACKGPISNPLTKTQLLKNLMMISAHPTMLLYRGFFLAVFTLAHGKSFELCHEFLSSPKMK